MANIINIALSLWARVRRFYYVKVIFSKVKFNRDSVNIGPDVCRQFKIAYGENLEIGDGSVLNGECYINAQGGVRIGRYCHIGKGLTLLSSNHNFKSVTYIPYDAYDILKPVEIGDAVWIGANVCISPGSKIGNGVIVAMGAVVRGNIPSCAIVAGNPAQIVGWRDKKVFANLYNSGFFL